MRWRTVKRIKVFDPRLTYRQKKRQKRMDSFSSRPNICPFCGREPSSLMDLLRHTKTKHPDKYPEMEEAWIIQASNR